MHFRQKINHLISYKGIERIVFAVLILWLLFAAFYVQIEYFDGYDAVCNARFFLGKSDHYSGNRMPMMGLLLIPAELTKILFKLHPLEIRPHHLTMAMLHILYLFIVYIFLLQMYGRKWPVFLAFISSIPSYIFFSYSPFISHDIFPGMLFMVMLFLVDKYFHTHEMKTWVWIILISVFAAMIKQTYAIFWGVILLSYLPIIWTEKEASNQNKLKFILMLGAGAIISGVIVWVTLGYFLDTVFPNKPLIIRPYYQIEYVFHQYDSSASNIFPWWIYLRNFWVYGLASLLLIIPGLIMAWKGGSLQKLFAFSWILSFLCIHMFSMREVRYIVFLAPLTAFLIVPPFQWLFKYRTAIILFGGLVIFNSLFILPEALRIFYPFYTASTAKQFLQPLEETPQKVVVNCPMLSFVSPVGSFLVGDRYHRLFHFGVHHMLNLYGVDWSKLTQVKPDYTTPSLSMERKDGDILIYSNAIVVNNTLWTDHSRLNEKKIVQIAARNKTIVLNGVSKGRFENQNEHTVTIESKADDKGRSIYIKGEFLPKELHNSLLPYIQESSGNTGFGLKTMNKNQVRIVGDVDESFIEKPKLVVQIFKIQRLFKGGTVYFIQKQGMN